MLQELRWICSAHRSKDALQDCDGIALIIRNELEDCIKDNGNAEDSIAMC
jgi:hypothetical protein